MPDGDPDGHGKKYPEREIVVQKRELLPLQRCARLTLRIRTAGHDYLAFLVLWNMTGTGAGALWSATNFAGLQQAFASRALSACMARSSLSHASVWRSSCEAPAFSGMRIR